MWMPRTSDRLRLTKALTLAPLLSIRPSLLATLTGVSISPMPTHDRAPATTGRASAAMSGITRTAHSDERGATGFSLRSVMIDVWES